MNARIVAVLLAIYPAAWREEYGAEFRHLLEASEPRAGTLVNVLWHGLRQRLRATEPWLLLGLPFALVNAIFYTVMILVPPAYAERLDHLIMPAMPVVLFTLLLSLSLLIACGFWTLQRSGGTVPHAGWQTMKMTLLTWAPALIVGALVLTGALGVSIVGPGESPLPLAERGFTIALYSRNGTVPHVPPAIILILLAELAVAWTLGSIGGALGRVFTHKPAPAT